MHEMKAIVIAHANDEWIGPLIWGYMGLDALFVSAFPNLFSGLKTLSHCHPTQSLPFYMSQRGLSLVHYPGKGSDDRQG
jgi:hypothetical protein